METKRENTVHTAATSAQDSVSKFQAMTNAQFESEKNYRIAVCVIRILKQNGLITAEEFKKMRTIIAKETGSYSFSLL